MRGEELVRRAKEVLGKYQYVLILLLVGVLLLALPTGEKKAEAPESSDPVYGTETSCWSGLEERLESALQQIEGAGEVSVVLTLKAGPRQVLAQEGKVGENSHETTTVLAGGSSGVKHSIFQTVTEADITFLCLNSAILRNACRRGEHKILLALGNKAEVHHDRVIQDSFRE